MDEPSSQMNTVQEHGRLQISATNSESHPLRVTGNQRVPTLWRAVTSELVQHALLEPLKDSKASCDRIAYKLNMRPRKRLGFKTPYEVYYETASPLHLILEPKCLLLFYDYFNFTYYFFQ